MLGVLLTLFAEFRNLDLSGSGFLVLLAVVVDLLARAAPQFNQSVLAHKCLLTIINFLKPNL